MLERITAGEATFFRERVSGKEDRALMRMEWYDSVTWYEVTEAGFVGLTNASGEPDRLEAEYKL